MVSNPIIANRQDTPKRTKVERVKRTSNLRISLNPVKLETSKHLNLSFWIFLNVPPELINLTLFFLNTCKIGFKFDLSETDIKADLIFFIIFS